MAGKKCEKILSNGTQCRAWALKNKGKCFSHDEESKEKKAMAVSKGGASKEIVVATPLQEITVNAPADIIKLLSQTISEVRAGTLDPRIASTLGYLSGVLLKAFEVSQLNEKVELMTEIIEARPKQRDVYGR